MIQAYLHAVEGSRGCFEPRDDVLDEVSSREGGCRYCFEEPATVGGPASNRAVAGIDEGAPPCGVDAEMSRRAISSLSRAQRFWLTMMSSGSSSSKSSASLSRSCHLWHLDFF